MKVSLAYIIAAASIVAAAVNNESSNPHHRYLKAKSTKVSKSINASASKSSNSKSSKVITTTTATTTSTSTTTTTTTTTACNPLSGSECFCITDLDCEELVTDVCVDTNCEEEICILSSVGCPASFPQDPCQRTRCDSVEHCNPFPNGSNGEDDACESECCEGVCCSENTVCENGACTSLPEQECTMSSECTELDNTDSCVLGVGVCESVLEANGNRSDGCDTECCNGECCSLVACWEVNWINKETEYSPV